MTFAPETIHPDSWPRIHRILAPALARAGTTAASLIDDLLDHSAQLWVKRKPKGGDPISAAVTELIEGPNGLLVHGRILAGAGGSRMIDEAVDVVMRHARKVNAIGIRIEGRAGWERVLSAKGWTRRAVVMELHFEPETVDG